MALDQAKVDFSLKVKANLAQLEAMFPDSIRVKINHHQWNTAAIAMEDADGVPRGTYGGANGTVTPDSGGTDKGGG
jgi:hypothetical protein